MRSTSASPPVPPPTGSAAAPRSLEPDPGLFRREAIDRHVAGEESGAVLALSPPWTWAGLAGAALVIAGGVGALLLVETEVTGRALAVVRPSGGDAPASSHQKLQVTAFLPERDRPLVKVGDVVRLELHGVPPLEGRISRIAGQRASVQEMHEALGDDVRLEGLAYRVEARLLPSAVEDLGAPLRSGMTGRLRYTARRKSLLSTFGPLSSRRD